MSLPSGWEGRSNAVTEEAAMQGRLMADRFTSNAYASMGENVERKTDEEVAAFYLGAVGGGRDGGAGVGAGAATAVAPPSATGAAAGPPSGWGERQRLQQLQAEALQKEEAAKATASSGVALVRVATYALDQMAGALESNPEALPDDVRAAFAAALGRAMQAAAKAR